MSEQTPSQQFSQQFQSLMNDARSLQLKAQLSQARDSYHDFLGAADRLPGRIQELRKREYRFERDLAERAAALLQRLAPQRDAVKAYLDNEAMHLRFELQPIEAQMSALSAQGQANPEVGLSLLQSLRTDIHNLESKISAIEANASGMYSEIQRDLNQLKITVDQIDWTLDRLDEACFNLKAAEAVVMAVKATWTRDNREDKDDPQGCLFLTDQRLLFEQNQEVATKKVLFITTEKKKVQQLVLDFPVGLVEDIQSAKKGLFKNEDFIDLRLASEATVPAAQFHIFGHSGADWVGLVNRVQSHEIDSDRIVAVDQATIEKVRTAPTECPACGAAIRQAITRGMDSLTCEYCGQVIRI